MLLSWLVCCVGGDNLHRQMSVGRAKALCNPSSGTRTRKRLPGQAATGGATAAAGGGPAQQSGEAAHPLSWLHGVPFSLAPRYQLGRQGQQDPPSSVFVQLSQADESLKSYAYDFALERSVLCSS
ncbi:unnamed protein product [Lampetra fluviatilis]